MNHPQEVEFTKDGKTHTDVFYCGTGQQAMKECRLKHRGIEVTGAQRLFPKGDKNAEV